MMKQSPQAQRAQTFRQRHHASQVLLLPNGWDAGTAKLLAHWGFEAVATTSGGVAWSLGYADGEHAPLEEVLGVIGRMAQAVSIPVTADMESGYGATASQVAKTIEQVIQAGAVGVNLEDGVHRPGQLRPMEESAERILAARTQADAMGVPIVINARVDTYLAKWGDDDTHRFAETVRRAQAYLKAGADCIYPLGLSDFTILKQLASELRAPINIMAYTNGTGSPTLPELQSIGITRISTATRLSALALGALEQAAKAFDQNGQIDASLPTIDRTTLQQVMSH